MYSGRIRNITLDLNIKQANTNKNLCCEQLKKDIDDPYNPVEYSERVREYSIKDFESTSITLMTFCYHCGSKFPHSLRDTWFDILEEKYAIEYPLDDYKEQAPKEFHTDEWWKKRNL